MQNALKMILMHWFPERWFKSIARKFEAYDIISEEISGVWASGISDICGALTACRCQGDWGHSPEYWEKEPSRVEKEAFANMFEASIGDNKNLQ